MNTHTATPLFILAKEKLLPEHQFMDVATLTWLNAHRPEYLKGDYSNAPYNERLDLQTTLNNSFETLQPLLPLSLDWFTRINASKTLHGELHAYRVALLAGIIANHENPSIHKSAIIGGLFHDVARINDQTDEGHGVRSATILAQRIHEIDSYLQDSSLTEILGSIRDHESTTKNGPLTTVCVQTGDALDRFRLPKLKWWPDLTRMTWQPSELLLLFAYDLVTTSEKKVLDGMEPYEAFQVSVSEMVEVLAS